jgi:hypothetical protein
MFISKQLKQQNIAEYLIYMWQVEDLIRAYGCNVEQIRQSLVARYPAEQQAELGQWYEDLIEMMRREEVMQQGHLQINKNVIINLTDLHLRLLKSPKMPFYSAAYYKALPFIVEFRTKSDGRDKGEIENCFDALYMVWLMKLQRREINEATMNATNEITRFISMLSLYFKEDEEGRLDLDAED